MRTKLIFLMFFCFISIAQFAQTQSDIEKIKQQNFEKKEFQTRKVTYGFTKGKKTLNPFYHMLSTSMYVYQKFISPQLSRGCAFNPSCSEYSKELIKEYGLIKGSILTSDRLTRCTRIALTGKPHFLFETPDGKINEKVDRYKLEKKTLNETNK